MVCSTAITTRLRAEGERREYIGGDVSNENPDSVNFPVDGFQGGSRVQVRGEQRENVTRNSLGRWWPRLPARNSLSTVLWSANPYAMCAELLLIKGIVERLVGRSRRGPTTQSVELRLAVWIAGRQREEGSDGAEGWIALRCCVNRSATIWNSLSRSGGSADRRKPDLTFYANSRISISWIVTCPFLERECLWDVNVT